jgi:hypothetical protein
MVLKARAPAKSRFRCGLPWRPRREFPGAADRRCAPGLGEAVAEHRSPLGAPAFGAPDVMNESFMTPDALKESFMTSGTAGFG